MSRAKRANPSLSAIIELSHDGTALPNAFSFTVKKTTSASLTLERVVQELGPSYGVLMLGFRKFIFVASFILAAVTAVRAADPTGVSKQEIYIQTSTGAPAVPALQYPFEFTATSASSAATVTPPGMSAITLPSNGSGGYELDSFFTTQASLDASFPNGSYTLTTLSNGTFNFSLTGNLYPGVPQVVGGTWQNNVLVVDPTQNVTLNLNSFPTYATAGIAGVESFNLSSQTSSDNVNLKQTYSNAALSGGNSTQSSTPFASYVIPAGTLTAGLFYQAELNYITATALNTSNGLTVSYYSTDDYFYIVAKSSTSTPAPTITSQPSNQTAVAGGSVTFSVGTNAAAMLNVNYNWYLNGNSNPFSGNNGKYFFGGSPNSTTLTINNVTAADAGSYGLEIVDAGGEVQSQYATLSLVTGKPAITIQPAASQSVNAGANVTLSVAATSAGSYQWQLNGSSIAGATNATLTLSNIGTTQRGTYTAVVSNVLGSVTSSPASVAVSVGSSLYNISSRAYLGSGTDQNIVAGFYTNGSGSKNVVLGGIGPDLAVIQPSLSGLILTNPKLTLFNGSATVLATNTAWGGSQTLINALASVYAPPLPTNSNDTLIFTNAPAGPGIGYTAEVDGLNNTTGIALVEAYDYDAYTGTPASNLINISTRAFVGTGNDVLVAGFWTIGSTSQTVLIRAVGPGLAASNSALNGLTLATPTLTLYDSTGATIATNTGWGNAPVRGNSTVAAGIQQATTAIMNGVFASPIAVGSADCAMVVTLPANAGYTAQVNGVGSTTGIALVEAYNVP
jgi:hypothetical protein